MNAPEPTDTDPTASNELAQLRAMVDEQPRPGGGQASAEAGAEAAIDRRAERVAYYASKITPFVDAYGSRLKRPLLKQETDELSAALADVAVEILPDGGGPVGPWVNLSVVVGMIAAPRIIAAMNDERRVQAGDGGADSSAAEPAKPEKRTGDTMLDALAGFDTPSDNKPH